MATAKKKTSSRTRSSARKAAPKSQPKVKPAAAANQAWAQQSAKMYPFPPMDSAQDATKAAAQQMQSATEQMMRYGSEFMNQMFASAPAELSGVKAKVKEATRDNADRLSRSTSAATRSMNDVAELSRENAETLVECGNIAVAASKQLGAELTGYINRSFANNVELSKQAFTCRTLNDMFDLNNKFVKSNLDAFFNESVKLSELLFQAASDVSEPLNERLTETTDRLTKSFAA